MTILIRPIVESKAIFDFNSRAGTLFHVSNGKCTKMTDEEQKEFHRCNFAIGYCGSDRALSAWSSKHRRELTNINILPGEGVEQKRTHLWKLLQTDFESIPKQERRKSGYYELRQYQQIVEALRSGKTITLWYLSTYDIETAQLFKRFFEYLSRI